jgi:hypothetical protein
MSNNFAVGFFDIVDTLFAGTAHQMRDVAGSQIDFLSQDGDLYAFNFVPTNSDYSSKHSDSLTEIIEIAIRTVEKEITSRLVPGELPYTIVKLAQVPTDEFKFCFDVLERPNRVEMYTDTFRKGIAKLREYYKV